jgi:hypothetical protein
MVQSTENWCRQNASDDLNSPRYGRALAQGQMCACAVVIVDRGFVTCGSTGSGLSVMNS